jgi:TolB-like protein/Tfp pilus assembly protein PilF
MKETIRNEVAFGPFRLDIGRRTLHRDGIFVALGVRAMDILCALVEAKGNLVTKDDLMDNVWRGIVVDENNIQVQISALRRVLGNDQGHRYVLTVPGRGYRLERGCFEQAIEPLPTNKPSLAVLPFQNIGGNSEQDYFADGIVDDIITALSRMRWLTVIARGSSFTYKNRAVGIELIGQQLGVRYVLKGSVRIAANQIRVVGHLIDTSTGVHLWSDSFNSELADVFELQDQVAARVVGALAPRLEQAEIDRSKRKPTGSLDAYDYFLRGVACIHRETKDSTEQALRLFQMAVEFDPEYASAYGMAAWCYCSRKHHSSITAQEVAEAVRLARRAVELGQDDAIALTMAGRTLVYVAGDFEAGTVLFDRALTLNPNLAVAWNASGWLKSRLGQHDVALEHLSRAMRLSPLDPLMFNMQAGVAFVHFFAGRYDESSRLADQILQERPNDGPALRIAAAAHALGGRLSQAKKVMQKLRAMYPDLRIPNLNDQTPLYRVEDRASWAKGMRLAGLPD